MQSFVGAYRTYFRPACINIIGVRSSPYLSSVQHRKGGNYSLRLRVRQCGDLS